MMDGWSLAASSRALLVLFCIGRYDTVIYQTIPYDGKSGPHTVTGIASAHSANRRAGIVSRGPWRVVIHGQ